MKMPTGVKWTIFLSQAMTELPCSRILMRSCFRDQGDTGTLYFNHSHVVKKYHEKPNVSRLSY